MKDYSDSDRLDQAIEASKNDLPSADEIAAAGKRAQAAIMAQRGPQSVVSNETDPHR